MSKKSRKRNKILGAMLLGLGAAKLGMSSKGTGSSNVVGKTPEFRKSFVKPKKIKYITKKSPSNKFPLLKVTDKGDVIKKGVNTGVGNNQTKFISTNAKSSGIFQGGKKISDLNPKAISVLSDGSIKSKGVTYKNKSEYSAAMKKKRGQTGSAKSILNKFILGKKTQLNKGSMVKARGGGIARMKPTKLY
mgnify:CR=1 FL=1